MKKQLYKVIANLSEKTELPLSEMCREFNATISGRREVVFEGVVSIDKYEQDEIVLLLCGERASVRGEGLELKSYYKTSLCIRGHLDKIEFMKEEKK